MLSVLIPARNEVYLEKTIRNVLENARGELEILVALDGYLPEPRIITNDPRVIFYHEPQAIGQRQSINKLAKLAKGDFVMKLDAHCAVDEGFDVKLAADYEPDWTVVPRMYNLDIATWKPKFHKRTDYMYISGPAEEKFFRASYYDHRVNGARVKEPTGPEIDDTLCCMGPGWFLSKERFWELGGCDEGHGGWGQQGIEVALKAWLSGGSLKVNKKTWFAHWFRGGGGPGWPYPITDKAIDAARSYSQNLWLNDAWPQAKRKFQWVINKFNPPGWETYMHQNSLDLMKDFVTKHLPDESLKILDLGSQIVKGQEHFGSYKQFLTNPKWTYVGADIAPGNNVDVVLPSQYAWSFKDNEFDVVITGQTLEHVEFPWVWLKEAARVLKPGGKLCAIAPSVIHEHRYPVDCYRYYPDGMKALAKWCGLTVLETRRVVANHKLEDTILVAQK